MSGSEVPIRQLIFSNLMLLVRTRIGPSAINGIGCFADQSIPRGTVVWQFVPGLDIEISEAELARLPSLAQRVFLKYAYRSKLTHKYILCFDDARFFNHSSSFNLTSTGPSDKSEDITLRDISAGEELTVDYRQFDADASSKLTAL